MLDSLSISVLSSKKSLDKAKGQTTQMSEVKDPAIKLFGKTIPLPEPPSAASTVRGGTDKSPPSDPSGEYGPTQDHPSSPEETILTRAREDQEPEKDPSESKLLDTKENGGAQPMTSDELTDRNATSPTNKNSETTSVDLDTTTSKNIKSEEQQSKISNSEDKTLKKPDKILPCPRCNSTDTKFCYYNNYNVNQPRHFCKNCQRYWTAGGTMRNVPLGAGRRKNKNSASHYRHITVSETLQNRKPVLPNGIQHHTLKPNGTVLAFGSDTPLCESVASTLSEKTMQNCSGNGFHKPAELRIPVSCAVRDSGNDHSSGSSVTAASSNDEIVKTVLPEPTIQNCQSFPVAPWPYSWNSTQWSSPISPPAFCPAGFPMPLFPAAPYWGCTVPGPWNITWVNQPTTLSHGALTSGPNSPTLGKHSREDSLVKSTNTEEEEPQKESNPEKCLWVPKTLRIDDPGEAARSSIWETLGIKYDKEEDSISAGGLFKDFQSKKGNQKTHTENSTFLEANPAALSRSLTFHESS